MTRGSAHRESESIAAALTRLARRDVAFLPAAFAAVLGTAATVVAPPTWLSRVPVAVGDIVNGDRAALTSRARRLQDDRDALAAELVGSRNAIALREAEASRLRDRTEVLRREVTRLEGDIATHQAARREATLSLERQRSRIEELTRENARLEARGGVDRRSDRAVADLRRELALAHERQDRDRRAVANLETAMASLRGSLERSRGELRAVRNELAVRAAEVARLSAESDKLNASLAAQRELNRDIETVRAQAAKAARLAQERERRLVRQQADMARIERDSAALRSELAAKDARTETLSGRLSDLQQRHDRVRAQLAEAEEHLAAAARSEASASAELAAREKLIDTQRVDLGNLAGQLRTVEAERDGLRREVAAQKTRLAETRQALDAAQQRVGALQRELTTERETASRLERRIGEMESKLAALRAERDQTVQAGEGETARQEKRIAELSASLSAARGNATAARASLSSTSQRAAAAEGQVQALKASLRDSQQALSNQEAKLSRLNLHATAAREEVLRLIGVLKASDEKSRRLQKMVVAGFGAGAGAAGLLHLDEMLKFRSEFFRRLSGLIGDQENVRTVGDRFVLQAEVLFDSGSAELGELGRAQLAKVATTLKNLSASTPAALKWVLRVDGHTDRVPIQTARFPSNWELSAARAIAVVRFLIAQGVPPERLSANGFGEHQPLDMADSRPANRRNRRIELKLTAQ